MGKTAWALIMITPLVLKCGLAMRVSVASRDLRYISIQQYINTISMYNDMILHQANINIRYVFLLNH